jgi:hypothetical protein
VLDTPTLFGIGALLGAPADNLDFDPIVLDVDAGG